MFCPYCGCNKLKRISVCMGFNYKCPNCGAYYDIRFYGVDDPVPKTRLTTIPIKEDKKQ